MTTEYEVSTSLLFWGDNLDSKRLAADLQLPAALERTKGEHLIKPDGTDSGSVAKTGTLRCQLCCDDPSLTRNPEAQMLAAVRALKQLRGSLDVTYGVADAQFQMDCYYKEKIRGEPDFIFPPDLLKLLVRHRIELRITILP